MTEKKTILPNSEWSLGYNVISQIVMRLPPGSTILELGSGESSRCFAELGYRVYAIEHDKNFLDVHDGVNYIYAPLDPDTGWYNLEGVKKKLPETIHCLIIDGPTDNRGGIIEGWMKLLEAGESGHFSCPMIVIDDFHRADGQEVFCGLLNQSPWFHMNYNISVKPSGQLLQPIGNKQGYEGSFALMEYTDDRRTGQSMLPNIEPFDAYRFWYSTKEYMITSHEDHTISVAPSSDLRSDVIMSRSEDD